MSNEIYENWQNMNSNFMVNNSIKLTLHFYDSILKIKSLKAINIFKQFSIMNDVVLSTSVPKI